MRRLLALGVFVALVGCGGADLADTSCVLGEEVGTERTRVSDCEFALADGSRVRLALVRHRDAELGTLDVSLSAWRLWPDGSIERLSADEASAFMAPSAD